MILVLHMVISLCFLLSVLCLMFQMHFKWVSLLQGE